MRTCNMNINKLNNKTLDIFGTKYTIKFVDTLDDDTDTYHYGVCSGSTKTIQISKKVKGIVQTKDELSITLLHEIVHAILDTGQYNASSSDEPLVEWLARSLYSLMNQNIL